MKTDAELMNEFFETNHYASTGVEKFDEIEFAKGSPDQPRDERGRFASAGGQIFVSPNEKEGTHFQDALEGLKSQEHAQFHATAQAVVDRVAGGGTVSDIVGDWADGAENSLAITAHSNDINDLRYAASLLGEQANQKAVIAFRNDKAGPDSVWSFNSSTNIAETRDSLAKLGVQFRSLNQTAGGGTRVQIFDVGSSMTDTMQKVGEHFGAPISRKRGFGEFIGGDSREDGHAAYRQIIGTREAAKKLDHRGRQPVGGRDDIGGRGEHDRRDAPVGRQGLDEDLSSNRRYVDTVTKYSPDQPRDDHGRFGEGSGTADTRSASSAAITRYASKSGFAYVNSNLRSEKLDAVAPQVRAIDAAFKDPEQPERAVSTSEQNVQRGLFIERDARTPEQKAQDMKTWLANVPADVREAALKNPPQPRYDEALATALESGALKPGDVIRDKAFVSTTTDPAVSFGFSAPRERDDEGNRVMLSGTHVVMDMHVPAGTVHLVPQKGAYGNEGEQIYPRGSGIKITSIEKMPFANMAGEKYPGTDHTYTIHGEYVPPDVSKAASFWIPDHAVDIAPSKLAKYSPDQPREPDGKFGEGDDKTEGFHVRKEGENAGHEDLDKTFMRAGHLYRGMTQAEYSITVGAGKGIKSNEAFSMTDEGTSLTHEPSTAESYANYGRDDPRKSGNETYLVEVKTDSAKLDSDGYYKAKNGVPQSDITRVWEMRPEKGAVVAHRIDVEGLAKYSPDQPRDDHGRFGSGGDSIPLTDKGRQDAQENYDRQRDTVALRGETVARELGFPTDNISYNSNPPPTFVLNGRTIEYAGAANLKTGDITIYTRNTPDEKSMDYVMSHEIGHQMYQPVVDAFHAELERANGHERIERSNSEGHVRMMPLMTTDGSMREDGVDPKLLSQLKESFPVWSTVGKVDNASTSKELEEKDGVSQYSREWWKAANDGTATRHQAMHETMAEINRVVYESKRDTGKMWGSEEAKQVAPVWRRYYRAYAKAFDMIKGKKK